MMLNLVGEVGEFAGKVAKAVRTDDAHIGSMAGPRLGDSQIYFSYRDIGFDEAMLHLKLEAGDILWQLAGLCKQFGWTLEEVAQANLDKLASRKQRNKIIGDGDDR